jgi:hypothetical protein
MRKYNLYFNFFNKWQWRNVTIDKIKNIITNQYSDLIKHFDFDIYNHLKFDLLIDKDFQSLAYFKNGKKFISIRECK